MFGNLINGSQNTVWRLMLEGEIPQNYANCSNSPTLLCVSVDACILYFSVAPLNQLLSLGWDYAMCNL